MAIPSVLAVLPLGLLFLLSGLVVNAVQGVLFMSVRPLSRSLYRRINGFVAELLWLQAVWLLDWWAGIKMGTIACRSRKLSANGNYIGKEHALVISNHRGDIDWIIGWILAERSGCLGSALGIMKKSSKFLPVIGWSWWFTEYLFLEGSWAKDQDTIKVHVHIKRHAMSNMPKSAEDVSKWCKDMFVAKDALLDKHIATGNFGDEIRPIGRPMKPLLLGGSVLVMPSGIRCLQILTVDAALVDMERRYPLCCWIGAGGCHYARLNHCLSVRALELYQSGEQSSEGQIYRFAFGIEEKCIY
ncbi:hypothetical protein ACP70R_018728 [Stipagrostis hirtigluma subsp. patula]